MNKDVDIIIVGGGAAGIGAARRLAGSGLSTRLLESSSRLGGRALTTEMNGLDLDIGCGWLHSAERNSWVRIAKAAGVPLDETRAAWRTQFHDLGFSTEEQEIAGRAFGEWSDRLARQPPPSDKAADALAPGGAWNNYVQAIVSFISGAPLERLSAADYTTYDETSTDQNWRSRRGYGALVAGSFPDGVALSLAAPVQSIAFDGPGVTVKTRAGDLRARAVILTVSTSVLAGESIKLPRELDPWREAARALPLGRNEKLFLEITGDGPFEPETHVLGDPRDARTGAYYIRPFGWRVIECFLGGEGARVLDDGGPADAFAFTIDQLVGLFGTDIRVKLRPLIASNWTRMLRIGGAYSYALPGHSQARQILARPFDQRVFFAGEATSPGDFSTAHGALDSGTRAAEEVLESIGAR